MKPKTLVLMVVAVGCGLAASYMTSLVLADRGSTNPEPEKVTVLVAKQNIPVSTLLKEPEKYFEEKQYTKGEEPKKGLKDIALLKDRRLNKALSAEQFVSLEDLNEKGHDGISSQITPGMRAVALRVNADSQVGGFVQALSHVDIISVIQRSESDSQAKIIMQNVLVLAVDTARERKDGTEAFVGNTVTVQVTPRQAEKLSLAQQMGTLRLSLRSFGDEEKTQTVGMTIKGIMQGSDVTEESGLVVTDEGSGSRGSKWTLDQKALEVPPPPPSPTVETKAPEPQPAPKVWTTIVINGPTVTKARHSEEPVGSADTEKNPSDAEAKTDPAPRPSPTKQ